MDIKFILSQIIALIVAIIFMYSLLLKDNKKMFKLHTIESFLGSIKTFILNR